MSGLSLTKNVFRYAAMPEIMPRVRSLVFGGFGYIPFFIASLYQMVGLLPRNHPYLMPNNVGRFGVRHVIAQAASNITFSLKNIDQIVMFLAVIVGVVIFLVQIFALLSVFIMQPAMALPTSWAQFFTIVNPGFRSQDIAFMMLDMVFGVPHPSLGATTVPAGMGFFESCVGDVGVICQDSAGNALTPTSSTLFSLVSATDVAQLSPLAPQGSLMFPWPFHQGLHALFGVYNTALLIIATMVMSYFVAVVIGETMQSGTPFGRRFNKTWAPIRIVVAFGLLMPLTIGLNSSQYIVLYAAKFGSAFATNGWRYFNDTLTTSYLGSGQQLISTPNVPKLDELTQFMYVAKTCQYVYDYYHRKQLQVVSLPPDQQVKAYLLLSDTSGLSSLEITGTLNYAAAKAASTENMRNMKIRFGVRDKTKYASSHDGVSAICGEVTIPFTDGANLADQDLYVRTIQEGYFHLVRDLWHDDTGTSIWVGVDGGPGFPASTAVPMQRRYVKLADDKVNGLPGVLVGPPTDAIDLNDIYVSNLNDKVKTRVEGTISTAVLNAVASGLWGGPYNATAPSADALYSRGWASAGIWYNRVAQLNGQVSAAAFAAPMVSAYPAILEQVSAVKSKYDATLLVKDRFKPVAAGVDNIALLLDKQYGLEFASVLYYAYDQWRRASGVESEMSSNNNPIIGFIKYFFGFSGLYNMRANQASNTHPLAQLSGTGKALVEGAIRSLSYAGLATVIGGFGIAQDLMSITSNFLITFAMMGLTVGFVMFYVVPFLPFIYFFFAVGGWIKGIFEAMVGAPLWALAHIRIDGTGLPGQAAINGYFLIFEVFLRPILIVFGMLASISTYSALVSVLNSIFSMVTENVGGFDLQSEILTARDVLPYMRSEVDEFFFTVIYAIIVYMLGMSSFKLVDTMPNNILRWMGQSVATFGDQREDPAANLVSRASMGSQQALGQIGSGVQAVSQAAIGKPKA